tara:strand:- start:2382 stop:2600 length:219 start_codon:yes stop_codon:yes gene_type:complete
MEAYVYVWMEVQQYLATRLYPLPDNKTGIMDLVAEIQDHLFKNNYEIYTTEDLEKNILISIISILARRVHAK